MEDVMVERIVAFIENQIKKDMQLIKAAYRHGLTHRNTGRHQKRLLNNINSLVEWRKFL
jgi:hypothetical protein